ncbi:MAG: hypothetical protein ABWY93_18735 [Mycobacterium sp.]
MWDCQAYGPEGADIGALCFLAGGLHERVCLSVGQCHAEMAVERVRVFNRIQELAAAGDPVAIELAQDITSPDQLLNGDQVDAGPAD